VNRSRASSITKLPETIREKIALLRDQGRTLNEIMAALNDLDVDVSRSALGRYTKKMDQVAEDLRRSRELALAVSRQFGDQETSLVARTNMEILHSLLMKLMIGAVAGSATKKDGDKNVEIEAREAMFLSTALEKLTRAGKVDFEGQLLAAREKERGAALRSAAEKAVDEARKQGLSAPTIAAIKARILGVEA